MALVASKSVIAVDCPPGFRPKVGDSLLSFPEGCSAVLQELLEISSRSNCRQGHRRFESALRML